MTPAELLALAQQLLYDCCDPVTGESLYPGQSSYACVEDVEAAALYLRACAEAEPVATVRVHDTGGNAGIAWTGVPTENSCVMRGGTPLYTHPQPPSAQIARTLAEWHEDCGPVVWWRFQVDEPAWIGTPLDADWPGYHTHWTPHPPVPEVAR